MGLAIARKAARSFGASLTLAEGAGRGATFVLERDADALVAANDGLVASH